MSDYQWYRFEQLNTLQLYELLALRQQVFIVEQQSIYDDIDGEDQHSWHLLLTDNGVLEGYLRLRVTVDKIKIERVVVAAPSRGKKVGARLMKLALQHYHQLNQGNSLPLLLSAQTSALAFYRQFDFVEQGRPYDDGGIEHMDMVYRPGC